jgi:hypothetical protein
MQDILRTPWVSQRQLARVFRWWQAKRLSPAELKAKDPTFIDDYWAESGFEPEHGASLRSLLCGWTEIMVKRELANLMSHFIHRSLIGDLIGKATRHKNDMRDFGLRATNLATGTDA